MKTLIAALILGTSVYGMGVCEASLRIGQKYNSIRMQNDTYKNRVSTITALTAVINNCKHDLTPAEIKKFKSARDSLIGLTILNK